MCPSKWLPKPISVLRPLARKENFIVLRQHIVGTAAIARFPTLDLEGEWLDKLRQILLCRAFLVDGQPELAEPVSIPQRMMITTDEGGAFEAHLCFKHRGAVFVDSRSPLPRC